MFPAFLAVGNSQLPLWPVLVFFNFSSLRFLRQDIFFIFFILLFYISSILAEVILQPASLINVFYYLKQFLVLLVAVIVSRQLNLNSMHFALFYACVFSLIVGVLEFLTPGLCEYFSYVNAVRPCSGIRVSAFYNEPSHIAFLFFTFYIYSHFFGFTKLGFFVFICASIVFFSMTFITLITFILIYKLLRNKSGATVFLVIFSYYTFFSLSYLVLREYDFLPVQQSWDKRNLFFVNSFFSLDHILLYPFFSGRTFLYDSFFYSLVSNNFEIRQISDVDIVYSLSLLGGIFWSVGPLIMLWLFLKLLRSTSLFGLCVSSLLLGFPVSLFVIAALLSVNRFPRD